MKIFIISLVDSANRRAKISHQLNTLNLKFEFFDAVDARKSVPKEFENRIDRVLAKKRLKRNITNGELGCALSHALLYEKIINENLKHTFIFEDDAIIDNAFKNIINLKLLEKSKEKFVLFNHFKVRRFFWDIGDTLYKKYRMYSAIDETYCAGGYYITLEMAKILHNNTKVVSYTADWPLDIRHYAKFLSPRIVQQPNFEQNTSSLEIERNNAKAHKKSDVSIKLQNNIFFKIIFAPLFILFTIVNCMRGKPFKKRLRNYCGIWISARFEGK